jgi:sialic acid synthase SpsE
MDFPVFFSVFDIDRVNWCRTMDVEYYKIAWSQQNNKELLKAIPKEREVFISQTELTQRDTLSQNNIYLYCIPKYPVKHEELQFTGAFMPRIKFEGYSDHTIGLTACKVAYALGAVFLEKHFAVDHKTGVDAEWSMTPEELKELSTFCKETVKCLS